MKNRARLVAIVGTFVAGFFLTGSAHALERIRIGLSVRNVVFLPFYYAQDKGIYQRYGLQPELIQMRSDLQTVGLLSGEIDFTPAIGPAITAIGNGMPLKAIAVMYRAPVFALVAPPSVTGIRQVEGRQVAVSRLGSESHRYALMMMEQGGVDTKRVTFIQTGSTTVSLAALQQGAVSAAILSPPFTGAMAEKGYTVLARTRSLEVPWMGAVTSKQKLERQPEQARNLIRVIRDVIAMIKGDKPGVVGYIEKQFNVTPRVAADAYDDIGGIMIDNLSMADGPIKKYLDGAHARGEIARALTPADAFDLSLPKNLR